MAHFSSSSISRWLALTAVPLPSIPPCQQSLDGLSLTQASCAQVCNDSRSLFYPQTSNLETCGIWTTWVSLYTSLGTDGAIIEPSTASTGSIDTVAVDLLQPFQAVGLSLNNTETTVYADVISSCFTQIYLWVKSNSFASDGTVPVVCMKEHLFPFTFNVSFQTYGSSYSPGITSTTSSSQQDCINVICSPRSIDPDLAGIGVFSSFVIQSSIAITAFLALVAHGFWKGSRATMTFTNTIVAALVEFHKAQCFFLSTVQVTALILFYEAQISVGNPSTNSGGQASVTQYNYGRDVLSASVLVVLASSALTPTTLTITCIARYGRQSWYLLGLTSLTFLLATATLTTSTYFFHHPTLSSIGSIAVVDEKSCAVDSPIEKFLYPICGTSDLENNSVGHNGRLNGCAWAVWAYCCLCLIKCIFRKSTIRTQQRLGNLFGLSILFRVKLLPNLSKLPAQLENLVYASLWTLCFGYQFYLFGTFFSHSLISYNWSFGQIIAVAVWLPSIIEYLYILYNGIEAASKYRYPSPLKVMEDVVLQSVSMATFNSRHTDQVGTPTSVKPAYKICSQETPDSGSFQATLRAAPREANTFHDSPEIQPLRD